MACENKNITDKRYTYVEYCFQQVNLGVDDQNACKRNYDKKLGLLLIDVGKWFFTVIYSFRMLF